MSNYFDTVKYALHNAAEKWSFRETNIGGDEILRFEVRPGDHWRPADGTKERSEISASDKLSFNTTYTLSYGFMIEPGAKSVQDNVKIGQLHGSPDAKDSNSLGPVFALQLDGEKMRVVVRFDADATTTKRVDDHFVYTDKTDLTRGQWYDIRIVFRLDPHGDGLLDVYRDGVRLAHYVGPLGYNDAVGPYWKQGIYRAAGDVTMAVDYKNTTLVEGASSPLPTPPKTPDPTPTEPSYGVQTGTSKADTLVGTSGNDKIDGAKGNDTITGLGGKDYLMGGAGKDAIDGGLGDDTLIGGDGDDQINGGDGDDQLEGGSGNDVMFGGSGSDTLFGGKSNDTLDGGAGSDIVNGGEGRDVLLGGFGDDFLFGGGSADKLTGGEGDDRLEGGGSNDTFVFWSNSGRDTIVDWRADKAEDVVEFHGTFRNFAELLDHAKQVGDDVVIRYDSNDILTLENTALASLRESDFGFLA